MKKILFATLLFISAQISAEENTILCEKTYVNKTDIFFTEEGFLVQVDGLMIPIHTLRADAGGYYFNEMLSDQKTPQPWQCKWCLHWNNGWDANCQRCGRTKGSQPN